MAWSAASGVAWAKLPGRTKSDGTETMRGRRVSANPQSNKKCVTVWFQMKEPANAGVEMNLD
jgi:hypothetical protein